MDMFGNLAPILILLCYQKRVVMCLLKTSSVNKLIAINVFLHSISQFASFIESSSELDQMSCRPSPFMGVKTSWRTGETMLQRKYLWVKPCMALSEGYSGYTGHHQSCHREKCWAFSEFCFVFNNTEMRYMWITLLGVIWRPQNWQKGISWNISEKRYLIISDSLSFLTSCWVGILTNS